jgi:hypothetical protein
MPFTYFNNQNITSTRVFVTTDVQHAPTTLGDASPFNEDDVTDRGITGSVRVNDKSTNIGFYFLSFLSLPLLIIVSIYFYRRAKRTNFLKKSGDDNVLLEYKNAVYQYSQNLVEKEFWV